MVFFLLVGIVFCLFTGMIHSQEVIERYRLGNLIESATYCSTGDLNGKIAFSDGFYIYIYDPSTGEYSQVINLGNLGFNTACLQESQSSVFVEFMDMAFIPILSAASI